MKMNYEHFQHDICLFNFSKIALGQNTENTIMCKHFCGQLYLKCIWKYSSIMNRRHDKLLPLEFAKSTNLFLTFSKFVSVHHLAGGTLRMQPCFQKVETKFFCGFDGWSLVLVFSRVSSSFGKHTHKLIKYISKKKRYDDNTMFYYVTYTNAKNYTIFSQTLLKKERVACCIFSHSKWIK